MNGQLLKLIHGTGHIDTQVAKSHAYFIRMKKFIERLPRGPIHNFCLQKKHQVKIIEELLDSCYSVGVYKRLDNIPEVVENAMNNSTIIILNKTLRQYSRLLKDKKLYISLIYKNNLQTYSSAIQYYYYNTWNIGLINRFIKLSNCNCINRICQCPQQHYAIIQQGVCIDTFKSQGDGVIYDTREFFLIKIFYY